MVRTARYERRISQRELAELAGVAPSVVGRIESGSTVPRIDTLASLVGVMGYRLRLVDQTERPVAPDSERDAVLELRNRGGRALPVHLRPVPTLPYDHRVTEGYWWGWHHIAWPFTDDWVPSHTFTKRVRREVVSLSPGLVDRVWDDAT